MKKHIVVLTICAALVATSAASADVVGSSAVVTPASLTPLSGHQTYWVFVQLSNTTDVVQSATQWNVSIFDNTGTFFNMDPVTQDPFNVINNSTGGLTPVGGVAALPGYNNWRYDTNISIDDSTSSVADPGTSITSTSIIGGISHPLPPIAGADLLIQIGQITVTDGGVFDGFATINTSDRASTVLRVTNRVPAPGALALLGLAGVCRSRRRRA